MTTLSVKKQEAIANLDAELSKRVETLRQHCAFLTKSLITRCEIRITKLDDVTRNTKLGDFLQEGEALNKIDNEAGPGVLRESNKENKLTSPSKIGKVIAGIAGVKRKAIASPTKSPSKIVKKGRIGGAGGVAMTSNEVKRAGPGKRAKKVD